MTQKEKSRLIRETIDSITYELKRTKVGQIKELIEDTLADRLSFSVRVSDFNMVNEFKHGFLIYEADGVYYSIDMTIIPYNG
jgi:hypothetical protein